MRFGPNSATLNVTHRASSVRVAGVGSAIDVAFVSQERLTFDGRDCKILLHELPWTGRNPEVLLLNAYLDQCVNARPAQ